ncbi:MAG: hypothetical protein GY832_25895 [Chloroflexi bacterium]|nr:hypothetical protein [Chloroflexota bacterium]
MVSIATLSLEPWPGLLFNGVEEELSSLTHCHCSSRDDNTAQVLIWTALLWDGYPNPAPLLTAAETGGQSLGSPCFPTRKKLW